MESKSDGERREYRTIWISDVHLGFRGCSAEFLLDFLNRTDSQYLYLVGDIVDLWALKKRYFWPDPHSEVIRRVLEKAQAGTHVVFVPGNHDEYFRAYDGIDFGHFRIINELVHVAADGRRLLVLHGDQFDGVVSSSTWLSKLGAVLYEWLLRFNHVINFVRRLFGLPFWSLAAYLKQRVKNAVQYMGSFEQSVAREARRREVDGVVCGHIHRAEISEIEGVLYCNCGDWVESNTALVENADGSLELLRWSGQTNVEREFPTAA